MSALLPRRKPIPPLVMAVAIALTPAATWANGCGANTAITTNASLPIECLQPSGDAGVSTDGVSLTITTGNAAISVTSYANTDISIKDTTINEIPASGTASAVNARVNTGGAGDLNVSMSGTNQITLNANADSGVLLVNADGGNATLTISGALTLTNNADNSNTREALEVDAYKSGSLAKIAHTGSGTLTTHGGNVVLADGLGGTNTGLGKAEVSLGSAVMLEMNNTVSGASSLNTNAGIRARSSVSNKIDSAATISTSGNYALGIFTETRDAANATTTIVNRGGITTVGQYSQGILAKGSAIDLTNNGNISTGGAFSQGINAQSINGLIKINNTGNITTSALTGGGDTSGNNAIHAITTGTGNIDITSSGSLDTQGADHSSGIFARSNSGTITVNAKGNIHTRLNGGTGDSDAIVAYSTAGAVDVTYNDPNGVLTMDGVMGDGVQVTQATSSTAPVKVTITAADLINVKGTNAQGIYIGAGQGDVTVKNQAREMNIGTSTTSSNNAIQVMRTNGAGDTNIDSSGNIKVNSASRSPAIEARTNSGKIDITVSGNIATTGGAGVTTLSTGNSGIATSAVTGKTTIASAANISTLGDYSHGIYASNSSSGDIKLTNSINGQINTSGLNSVGMNASATQGTISITNDGSITTGSNSSAHGISASAWTTANSSNAEITNNGTIRTSGNNSVSPYRDAPDGINVHLRSGNIDITNNGSIVATGISADGVLAFTDGNTNITNNAAGRISGGVNGIGAQLSGVRQTVINAGTIDALSDYAVSGDASPVPDSQFDINNSGSITGIIWASGSVTTLDNSGTWNLRRYADIDGDGVRDTLAVAKADFGSSGNSSITNRGTIALLGNAGQAAVLDNTGEYATGYAANTMAINGAVQGQILNVKTFTNSGTIDLGPANPAVGDVLIISGGNTPGANGGGVYVANGGRLVLDTELNEGGANSRSDMLIVDGTALAAGGATAVQIINVGGHGAQTVDNGIELVRVLDSGRSADGVFRLSGRVVAGAYEYDLYKGGVGADAGNGNWYLRSLGIDPGPDPDNGGNGNQGENRSAGTPRTETGVYLRNLAAASSMFMHTLHDRLGEPQFTDAYNAETGGKVSSLWIRVAGNHTDGNAADGQVDLSTDTTLVHLGGDLARWSNNGNDRWHFGLMGAYGQSDTDASAAHHPVTPSGYQRTANGKVEGYGLGGYLTWYANQDKPTGPYIDLWGMYGWYDNKVKGNLLTEEKYDSDGWTLSVEGGYAFIAHDGGSRQLMIEPQLQVAYGSYSEDNHRERNGTWVTNGNYDGVVTRLGARVYSRSKQDGNGWQPFVEVNWWHGDAQNSLRFNEVLVDDGTPDNTYELKAGLQGEIAKNWQLWGHVGGRWGDNSYRSYEGMLGVKYQF